MRSPNPSEAALAAWLFGGIAATVAVQVATDGEHSVTDGARQHPIVFGIVVATFVMHVAKRPRALARLDPFGALTPIVVALRDLRGTVTTSAHVS